MRYLAIFITFLFPCMALASVSSDKLTEGWQEARYTQVKQVRERKKKVERRRLEQGVDTNAVVRRDPAPRRGPRRIR